MKKLEDIKVGETYYVRTKVISIDVGYTDTEIAAVVVDEKGKALGPDVTYFSGSDLAAISPIIPETSPKYDPCRKFRKGDKVRLKAYNGRKPYDFWHKQTIEHFGAKLDTVLEDELDSGNVDIFQDAPIDELTVRVHASHLELVTPVEELEPYMVKELKDSFIVYHDCTKIVLNDTRLVCKFMKASHPNAKAAAEAERDRLNAEWRKEQCND